MEDTVSRELALSTPHFSTPVSSPLVGSKLLLQKPILVVFHPPYWLFLFINNAASVVLLSLIPPRASRCFSWWLSPTEQPEGIEADHQRCAGRASLVTPRSGCN